MLQNAVPDSLKKAITVAIGLFQGFIGFQVMGLVVGSPTTLVTLGNLDPSSADPKIWLAIGGSILIVTLLTNEPPIKGAMFLGVWVMAIVSWMVGMQDPPQELVGTPVFTTLF